MTYLSMKQGQTRLKASAGIVLAVFMASEVSAQPVGWASRNGGTSGGAGGSRVRASTGTQIHQALCSRASSDTPIIIEVSGKITPGNTDKVSGDSCNTKAGVIELKDVSNVTLVGVGSGATFDEIGIHIRSSSNIILQNLYIRDVNKSNGTTSNGGDAIGMEKDVRNVWVDHCTLEAFGGEKQGYDGLLDMKNNTRYVTVSYTRYMNSGRGGLVGSSESDKNDFVTYHHNWWMNLKSRAPLLRHANAHIFNNLYDGIKDSGINVRAGGRALVENNYFVDSRNPLGTFYTNTNGTWEVSGNIFSNVVWQETSSQRPAGPNVRSTGGVSVPYSYSLDQANCVRDIVRKTAGANKGLRRSNGSCSNPTNPEPDPEPAPQPDPEPAPQPDPEPAPQPDPEPNPGGGEGTNLAIGAGSDGSSKASGSSYGNVRDGKLSSYWSPKSSSGERISVKKMKGSFNTVIVRELNGATSSWRLINADNGTVLGSGGSLGSSRVISGFGTISAKKISLMIDDASSPPQIAEIEIYN